MRLFLLSFIFLCSCNSIKNVVKKPSISIDTVKEKLITEESPVHFSTQTSSWEIFIAIILIVLFFSLFFESFKLKKFFKLDRKKK